MTITEARNILGEEIIDLTDKEVELMIQRDSAFCRVLLDVIEKTPLTFILKGNNNGYSD